MARSDLDQAAWRLHQAAQNAWFVISNDTEADDAWRHPDRLALDNIREVDRFQDLCERYQTPPSYLIAYECATRDEAIRVLKPIVERGACEIGHHLHVWSTPPFEREEPAGIDNPWLQAFQFELPDELFLAKANAMLEAIRSNFGVQPTSHRAGRWGIDQRTLSWLADNGFVVDTSVIPLRSLANTRGRSAPGPSFLSRPRRHSLGAIVELPVTVDVPDNLFCRASAGYLEREWPGSATLARLFSHHRVGGARRLSVDPRYPDGVLEAMIARALLAGVRVINLALHSSELSLHGSPFSRNATDLARTWSNLERILRYVRSLGMRGATLTQAALALRAEQAAPPLSDTPAQACA